jgi:2-polyprenyl-3-methyl-5-hydroxy-6-metoxy-1,4-benzoquinol methylase
MNASRPFSVQSFNTVYNKLICNGRFNEVPEYYERYKSRYVILMQLYARLAGPPPIDFLDIGGGQFATLAKALWNDRAVAADFGVSHFDYLRQNNVEPVEWNLCSQDQPFLNQFDIIMFSEVIEHLPIPGHLVLERLLLALKPGGLIICTTPNLYRARNVVYMAIGKRMFTNFHYPTDRGLGHILEYDEDHLRWQFERAGFEILSLEQKHFPHSPTSVPFRLLSWIGSPLYLIPRFRDQHIVVAQAPRAAMDPLLSK